MDRTEARKMYRRFLSVLIFLLCLFSPVLSHAGEYLKGRVVKVSDGDTVWVMLENGNRVKIRVWGLLTVT